MRASTQEIVAMRALNRTFDEKWTDWAVLMLEQGHDTPHLRILAGWDPPFNQFEMTAVVDQTLAELGLDWSNQQTAVTEFAVVLLEEMLSGERSTQSVLQILTDICIELDYAGFLYDFYLLYFAQDDLGYAEHQWYWPDADRSNIEVKIREYATAWLRDNRTQCRE